MIVFNGIDGILLPGIGMTMVAAVGGGIQAINLGPIYHKIMKISKKVKYIFE